MMCCKMKIEVIIRFVEFFLVVSLRGPNVILDAGDEVFVVVALDNEISRPLIVICCLFF